MTLGDPSGHPVTAAAGEAFDLRQRGNLADLDRQFHAHWNLGQNLLLAWCPCEDGVLVLVVPHHAIAEYSGNPAAAEPGDPVAHDFIVRLLSGRRRFSERQLQNAARLMAAEPVRMRLRQPLGSAPAELDFVERLIKRYSITYVPNRAVALFDIVGFGLLSPFEQVTHLNSLSCSLNAAHNRLLGRKVLINFARSTTGDGFYIWNRDVGLEANVNLYHFMHLVLADNAIARRNGNGRSVPLLRTSFHVGACYEFNHAEGLNPTIYNDVIGDVTIELARMIDGALPGQILVGEFTVPMESADGSAPVLDSISFMSHAQDSLGRLDGLELSGASVEAIKCYLTGRAQADGGFSIRRLTLLDKHGLSRTVFNAKVNIYCRGAEPILLGIEDRLLADDLRTPPPTRQLAEEHPAIGA